MSAPPSDWDDTDHEFDAQLAKYFPSFSYAATLRFSELFAPPSDDTRVSQLILDGKLKVQQVACENSRIQEHFPVAKDERLQWMTLTQDDVIRIPAKRRKRAPVEVSEKADEASLSMKEPHSDDKSTEMDTRAHDTRVASTSHTSSVSKQMSESATNTGDAATQGLSNLSLVAQIEWEDQIIWDESTAGDHGITLASRLASPAERASATHGVFAYPNSELRNDESWVSRIIWLPEQVDGEDTEVPLVLDLNDRTMLFEDKVSKPPRREHNLERPRLTGRRRIPDWKWAKLSRLEQERERLKAAGIKHPVFLGSNDPLNLSNDHWYQSRGLTVSTTMSLRQSMNVRTVEHSAPALRMQKPFFVTHLSEYETRYFHRLPLTPDASSHLYVVESLQTQIADRAKERDELRQKTGQSFSVRARKDLSAKDGGLILAEYCEEHPPLLMRTGMCTHILNYFKRSEDSEERAPEMPFGTVVYQGPKDPSPFLGKLAVGSLLQSFENNLFRAPAYPHKVKQTDFLVIRHQGHYYIREVNTIFVLGQECPKEQVPAPNSKRASAFQRDRLTWFICRYFSHKNSKLRTTEVRDAFPTLSEAHIRNRLKECAVFQRGGGDSGAWEYNGDQLDLAEERLHALLSPERVCAYESMQAALRRLIDAGYGMELKMESAANEDDGETLNVEDEVKMAPWYTTADFISCVEGKCLLAITGKAEPTGCDEGFSYLRLANKPLPAKGTSEQKLLPKRQPTKKMAARSLVNTEFDLRSLKKEEVIKKLTEEYSLSRESLNGVGRWQLIDVLRSVATRQALDNDVENRYARTGKSALTEHKDAFNEACQNRFEVQNRRLASEEVLSSSEDESDALSDDSDINNTAEAIESRIDTEEVKRQKEAADQQRFSSQLESRAAAALPAAGTPTPLAIEPAPKADPQVKRTLIIKRTFHNCVRREEVTDPAVIDAYLNYLSAKHNLGSLGEMMQSDEAAKNEQTRREKRQIREKIRRLDKAETRESADMPSSHSRPQAKAVSTRDPTLPCRACGELGHSHNNRMCPRFVEREKTTKFSSPAPGVKLEEMKLKIPKSIVGQPRDDDSLKLRISLDKLPPTKDGEELLTSEHFDEFDDYYPPRAGRGERARKNPKVTLNSLIGDIIRLIIDDKEAEMFLLPVNKKKVTDYDSIVRHPIDLGKMKAKADSSQYETDNEFLQDMRLLAANALLYNGRASVYYAAACTLREHAVLEHQIRQPDFDRLAPQLDPSSVQPMSLHDISHTDDLLIEQFIRENKQAAAFSAPAQSSMSYM